MKRFFKSLGALAIMMCASHGIAMAQAEADEEPIITFKTTVFENTGESNAFHIVMGAKKDTFIDMDCGYGPSEIEVGEALFNQDTQEIEGTWINGNVSKEGIVKIYGDPTLIDYLEIEGCYVTEISFPKLTNVEILNLSHNLLKSLDLSHMTKLQALYISDNPFNEKPLVIGADKPNLTILEMSIIDNLDPDFDITGYPMLRSIDAWHIPTMTHIDPSKCPNLLRLSIDVTGVSSLDVSKNTNLLILNIGMTKISSIDLTNNPYLTELYCTNNGSDVNGVKLSELNVTKNPELQRLSCGYNNLKTLDVSQNPKLLYLYAPGNHLTEIDLSNNPKLSELNLANNNMSFATLPADRNTFTDYYYSQRPIVMEPSYPEGAVFDFADKLNRAGSETVAILCAYDPGDPSKIVTIDEEGYFEYDNGKITMLQEYPDSLYFQFVNSALHDYPMTTTKFMVKNADEYGEDNIAVYMKTLSLEKNIVMNVGIAGATADSPKTFSVDFGDGKLVEFTAVSNEFPAEPNVTGTRAGQGEITVYTHEGDHMTAFGMSSGYVNTIDLSEARALTDLRLNGIHLTNISLGWNAMLTNLDLSNNNLTELDLSGVNSLYNKNMLLKLNVSHNRLTKLVQPIRDAIKTIDVSHNQFTEFEWLKYSALQSLNVSDNQITDANLQDLESINELNLAGNHLSTLAIPEYVKLNKLDVSRNNFTFGKLPPVGVVEDYTYAPQNVFVLPVKAPSVNLSSECFTDEQGRETSFTWYLVEGKRKLTDEEITDTDGHFKFLNPDLGLVYCEMSHPAFPAIDGENILKTTQVTTAPMPTHKFATFTTTQAGTGTIRLAGVNESVAVYIDWSGTGDVEQYQLAKNFQEFPIETFENVEVNCYSYDDNDGVTVFSIDKIPMSSMDASSMKSLIHFTCGEAGLSDDAIKLPASDGLMELVLSGNKLTECPDLSSYSELMMLNLSENELTSLDVTAYKALKVLYVSGCDLTDIKLDNPLLWELALSYNKLETVDLSRLPALYQLWLSYNCLKTLDLSANAELNTCAIDYNYFTIATLPIIDHEVSRYIYYNQYPLEVESVDGVVDLSSQAQRNGVATTFTWYIDSPYFDENGNLEGEDLYENEEYTIKDGVTSFLEPFRHIMCVMTNSLFPNLYLYTNFIDTVAAGIEEVISDINSGEAEYYNLEGIKVTEPTPGLYIKRQGNKVTKVIVK